MKVTPIPQVLERLRAGRCIILVDDAARENEGDLVACTELISAETVAFMMREGRGLICITLEQEVAERLNFPLQVQNNNSPFQTAFTVSVDHREVAGQGVTAQSRAFTMRRMLDPITSARDFLSPGHVFPLIANLAGVFGRRGQTEGSVDLARLAGTHSSGVICEILNPDGSMCRGRELEAYAERHELPITSIEELVQYRLQYEVRVRETTRAFLSTEQGRFEARGFFDDVTRREHVALVFGDLRAGVPLVRVHSECLTGDVFGSLRCDCGGQLAESLKQIATAGSGVVLYLRQEGRGIGLANKIRAYGLQDAGHDTVHANELLGFPPDGRTFSVAAELLRAVGVQTIRLLTNNPRKVAELASRGITIMERLPLIIAPTPHSESYLITKQKKLGHLLGIRARTTDS